jgi:hypothetical protein
MPETMKIVSDIFRMYPLERTALQEKVEELVGSLALQLLERKERILREHLYGRCDRCGELVPIEDVRVLENVSQLGLMPNDPNNSASDRVQITLKQSVFEVVCITCLESGGKTE